MSDRLARALRALDGLQERWMWVAGARRPYVCDTHDEYCSFRYWLASVERERGEKIPVRQECFPKRPKVAC